MCTTWRCSGSRWWERCIRAMRLPDPFAQPAQKKHHRRMPWMTRLGHSYTWKLLVSGSQIEQRRSVQKPCTGFEAAVRGTDATTNSCSDPGASVFRCGLCLDSRWPPSIDTWMDGLKHRPGICTNGPLIEFQLGGEMVGRSELSLIRRSGRAFTAKLRSVVTRGSP